MLWHLLGYNRETFLPHLLNSTRTTRAISSPGWADIGVHMKRHAWIGLAGLAFAISQAPAAVAQYVDEPPPNLRPHCRQMMVPDIFVPRRVWACPPGVTNAIRRAPDVNGNTHGVEATGSLAAPGSIGMGGSRGIGNSIGGEAGIGGPSGGSTRGAGGGAGAGGSGGGASHGGSGNTVADGGPGGGFAGPGDPTGDNGPGNGRGNGRGPQGNNGFGNGGGDGSPNGMQDVTR